jgi:hypothetical protein
MFSALTTTTKNVLKNAKYVITILIAIDALVIAIVVFMHYYATQSVQLKNEEAKYSKLASARTFDIASLEKQINSLTSNYSNLQNTATAKQVTTLQDQINLITDDFNNYSSLQSSVAQVGKDGFSTTSFNTQLATIQSDLLAQNFTGAQTAESSLSTSVNNDLQTYYVQTHPTPKPTAPPTPVNLPGSSYNSTTVSAQGKNYTVDYVSIDLTTPGLRVITDTANTSDCANNCPVQPLMSFYNNDHGFAAINGTYFCPYPATCSGDFDSFDFPIYNTNLQKWINQGNLFWTGRSMFTFNSNNTPTFYPQANGYSGSQLCCLSYPPVHSAIANAPGLVSNGQVIVQNFSLDAKSADELSSRGGMCTKGNDMIIAIALGATVPDMAYIMQAMGCTNALGLDGGGSSALIYNGQYMLGPGRNLPNAIVFALN